ncbi:MAG: hypothetical protein GF331_21175 [Chitinivibrionales bacterium]|nr:hypothetical protein [Chitinivibrionales bacterium]
MPVDVKQILQKYNNDAGRLMDILNDVQAAQGYVSDQAIEQIAQGVGLSRVDVAQTVSFYHFYTRQPRGAYAVYLNDSAVAEMMGRAAVAEAFEKEAGCAFGEVSADGKIGLHNTACIGMNDQEPAAIVNDVVFTNLTPEKAKTLVADMKAGKSVEQMVTEVGDGKNAHELVKAMVNNNIRQKGAVHLADYELGSALKKAVEMKPEEVIGVVKQSNLRGRGGAGFPTGMKWEFTVKNQGDERFVVCNADEGEPGTFKDRVILTELPERVFEGMAVAGYAIGAKQGIMYLRAEYRYLQAYLEKVLADMRDQKLLGTGIAGKDGFDFDIRIQFGAGAYVCGEESALLESAEGKRGEPRNRPPFPAEKGYKDKPTTVNNVETFSAVVQILVKGAEWFRAMGTDQSAGTKLLSISGDCDNPGIYEVEFGLSVKDMLEMAGATDVQAVQIGGPSGTCVAPADFDKPVGFEGFATGGSVIVIGKSRNLLEIVHNFMCFFADESCGSCVPCRAGTWIMRNAVKRIMEGKGTAGDLDMLVELGSVMKTSNKCGLGQTAGNPVVTTIQNLREVYDAKVAKDDLFEPGFDLASAVTDSCEYVGRTPNL